MNTGLYRAPHHRENTTAGEARVVHDTMVPGYIAETRYRKVPGSTQRYTEVPKVPKRTEKYPEVPRGTQRYKKGTQKYRVVLRDTQRY